MSGRAPLADVHSGGSTTNGVLMERLQAAHGRSLFRYLLSQTRRDKHLAEDLFQETMLRVWRRLDAVPEQEENARRWLFTIARRVAIDAARMRSVRPFEVSLLEADPDQLSDNPIDTTIALHTILQAFAELSESQRSILRELYVQGRSTGETADRLGLPVGTVKSRAFYALRSLRTAID